MAANKQHPKYPEYIEKCQRLRDYFLEEEAKVLERYPMKKGLDHPATEELHKISARHKTALQKLQQEYVFLFEE